LRACPLIACFHPPIAGASSQIPHSGASRASLAKARADNLNAPFPLRCCAPRQYGSNAGTAP